MRRLVRNIMLAAALVASGCGPAADEPEMQAEPAVWSLGSLILDVGGGEGDARQEFSRVADAVRLSSGDLAVLDQEQAQVTVFDPAGQFLFAFGRRGRGPGEFTYPSGLAQRADGTIQVAEDGAYTLHEFAPDGRFLRASRLDPRAIPALRDTLFQPHGMAALDDGSVLVHLSPRAETGPARLDDYREQKKIVRVSADFDTVALLGTFPDALKAAAPTSSGRRYFTAPYGGSLLIAPSTAEGVVYFAGTAGDTIVAVDLDGNEVARFSPNVARRPVTAADRERWIATFSQSFARMFQSEADARQSLSGMPFPAHWSAYLNMQVDAAGNLWLGTPVEKSDARAYYVLDAARKPSMIHIPRNMTLVGAGSDHVIVVHRDEDQVHTVRVYAIDREGSM